MNIRQARKVADLAVPVSGQRRPARMATMIRAFYRLRRKWRGENVSHGVEKADSFDAGRKTSDDYFRGNRLANLMHRDGVKVRRYLTKPAKEGA